jgi:pimeloyl-ACP methyl ester carboxylesterase
MPVLLLASTDEPKQGDGSGAVAAILPNAIRIAIPDGGHDPWFTQADVTFAEVRRFLSSP